MRTGLARSGVAASVLLLLVLLSAGFHQQQKSGARYFAEASYSSHNNNDKRDGVVTKPRLPPPSPPPSRAKARLDSVDSLTLSSDEEEALGIFPTKKQASNSAAAAKKKSRQLSDTGSDEDDGESELHQKKKPWHSGGSVASASESAGSDDLKKSATSSNTLSVAESPFPSHNPMTIDDEDVVAVGWGTVGFVYGNNKSVCKTSLSPGGTGNCGHLVIEWDFHSQVYKAWKDVVAKLEAIGAKPTMATILPPTLYSHPEAPEDSPNRCELCSPRVFPLHPPQPPPPLAGPEEEREDESQSEGDGNGRAAIYAVIDKSKPTQLALGASPDTSVDLGIVGYGVGVQTAVEMAKRTGHNDLAQEKLMREAGILFGCITLAAGFDGMDTELLVGYDEPPESNRDESDAEDGADREVDPRPLKLFAIDFGNMAPIKLGKIRSDPHVAAEIASAASVQKLYLPEKTGVWPHLRDTAGDDPHKISLLQHFSQGFTEVARVVEATRPGTLKLAAWVQKLAFGPPLPPPPPPPRPWAAQKKQSLTPEPHTGSSSSGKQEDRWQKNPEGDVAS